MLTLKGLRLIHERNADAHQLTDPFRDRRRRRSPTASCWRRWPGSATGSCACRRNATAPGLAVSEMVSSFGLHYRNERTLRELMRIHPDEHPVSMQLFGHDAEVMRSGAAIAAEAGADLIDINMGCPVPQGAQDRRRRRAAARPRAGAGAGPRRRRGQRPAGDGEAALRDRGRRPLRLRARGPPRRGGRASRRSASTRAPRPSRPQGQPRLRADPRAGRAGRGAGDRLRRARRAPRPPAAPTRSPAPTR